MDTLRNNIWHSGRTSENLLPGKMMFSQIQCCSPPELSAKHPNVCFGIHILKQNEAIERSTRNNTSTICIFKATLFTMTMPLSFTRQGDFYLQMIVLRKKFTVSSFFSLIGDPLSKSFNMPWLWAHSCGCSLSKGALLSTTKRTIPTQREDTVSLQLPHDLLRCSHPEGIPCTSNPLR